jgi:hypothetical protein
MSSERRAGNRFLMHSRVEITGVDESGLQFAERTHVEDVGDEGCRFTIRGAVHQGSVLGVEPLGSEGESLVDEFPRLFVVIWAKRMGDRMSVGTRSLREDELADGSSHIFSSASKSSQR